MVRLVLLLLMRPLWLPSLPMPAPTTFSTLPPFRTPQLTPPPLRFASLALRLRTSCLHSRLLLRQRLQAFLVLKLLTRLSLLALHHVLLAQRSELLSRHFALCCRRFVPLLCHPCLGGLSLGVLSRSPRRLELGYVPLLEHCERFLPRLYPARHGLDVRGGPLFLQSVEAGLACLMARLRRQPALAPRHSPTLQRLHFHSGCVAASLCLLVSPLGL